ncbi:hypothetical protein BUALT_Bualt03G0090800 [Buddleja alternifolia]|uniref:GAG-pre-integrase domain-containing protein n=1 Tax=Buddleja alternifolia TaxID=168488 RepID=A0AAV6Y0N2_9LAMI|nr:hypothetical protein BUALT_Bualt03G0090800 [Buddleja alternifolia]
MTDLLYVKNLHKPVFSADKPESKSDEDWEHENMQVCGFIRKWVEDNVYNHLVNETNARTLWKKLEQLYASKTGNNKLYLLKQMMNLRYKEGSSISDHLNDYQGILDQLSDVGVKFDDEFQALWLLNTFPDSWETFRVSLISSAPNGVMSMEIAKSGTLNEEMRRRAQSSSSQSNVLVTENRRETKIRIREAEIEVAASPSLNTRMLSVTIVGDYDTVNLACDETTWVIDSGASVHVTYQRDIFTSYTPGKFGDVRTANHGVIECIGVGEICLEISNGSKMVLKDVKHIPSVRLNLLSVGKLCGEKYDSLFSGDTWKLRKGVMVLARGKQHSNLYLTRAKVIRDSVNAVESNDKIIKSDDKTELWHMRLSHISEKGLDCLAKKNVLHGVKCAKLEKCALCFAGKQKVKCLLSEAKLPRSFWGEALSTAVHVINLSPTHSLNDDVPDKVWFDKDVSYDHLRVFGCKAIDEFGYGFDDPVAKKLVRSRDVVFMEDQTIDDITKVEKSDSQNNGDLVHFDQIPLSDQNENVVQNVYQDDHDDQQGAIGETNDAPTSEVVDDQQQDTPMIAPEAPLRRSTRNRQPSTRGKFEACRLIAGLANPST